MVKIVWTTEAIQERDDVFRYWNKRNQSETYSKKLRALVREALNTILRYPEIGKPTVSAGTRIKIVKDYLIVYKIMDNSLSYWPFGIADKIRLNWIK